MSFSCFFSLLRSCLHVEFTYFKVIYDLQKFDCVWALEGVLCGLGDKHPLTFIFDCLVGIYTALFCFFCLIIFSYLFLLSAMECNLFNRDWIPTDFMKWKTVHFKQLIFQHTQSSAWVNCSRQLKHFVGQIVLEWCWNCQRLHLLSCHNPTKSHPTHMLQTSNASGRLPKVHAPITSPKMFPQC